MQIKRYNKYFGTDFSETEIKLALKLAEDYAEVNEMELNETDEPHFWAIEVILINREQKIAGLR